MISVGIDVSKDKSMVCILKSYGEVLKQPFEIFHTEKALSMLAGVLSDFDDEVKVVMEATGYYHYPVLNYLLKCRFFVSVVNDIVINKYSNIALRKGKTDKKTPLKLSTLVWIFGVSLCVLNPSKTFMTK